MDTPSPSPSGDGVVGTLDRGRYRLTEKLGEGGMAAVYRAWDARLQRWCAIKVLLPEFARKKKVRRRFESEAALMARIDHRHVLSVFDVGTEGPLPWIVMELAEGGSLHEWVKRHGPMPPRLAIDVIMQVCKGLNAAHELGIIHRDVKPHNVLVTHRSVCKVTDFGIAHVADSGAMTKTGSVMGTLGYMAPEQRSDAKHVDVRADVYSVAATLYHLLTARHTADLFLAEHDDALLEGVPDGLAQVILKAAAYRPAGRHDNMNELARALHLARRVLPAIPDGTPPLAGAVEPRPAPPDAPSALSEIQFTELRDISSNSLDEPSQPEARPSPTPAPLPYLMPTQDAKRDDDAVPSYVVEEARRERPAVTTIAVDATTPAPAEPTERATPAPAARDDGGGDLDAAETVADLAWTLFVGALKAAWRPLSAIGLPMGALAAILAFVIGSGALQVRSAAELALDARQEVYEALQQEHLLIDDLVALGANRPSLEALLAEVERTRTEPQRLDAAMRYINTVEGQLRAVSREPAAGMAHKVTGVRERINRIHLKLAAYDEAVLAWEEAANSNWGSLAVGAGVAARP